MTQYAITRAVSTSLGRCELTHLARIPTDLDLARRQHADYETCLERLGCEVIRLPEEPELPDAVFVEDAAVVLDEIVEVHPDEACGTTALWIGETVIYTHALPRTAERLAKRGIRVELVNLSEPAKAEGVVTCCSLVFASE